MIAQRTIEEVKERASLLEIAGEFVKLRRAGSNYVGCCPFHAEKSGSFHIRDNGKFYHCFGCGVSGNAISFIMEARGLSFPDAVEELAARFGVRVEYEGKAKPGPRQPDRDRFYKLNRIAFEFFQREFSSAPASVREYLKDRGLNAAAMKEFGVGFAPNERNKLLSFLKAQGAPEDLIIQGGLARRSKTGDLYDTFRARLVFPIFVERQRVAGFGGRILPSLATPEALAAAPKYLNSPETPVYEKNKILFGLPHALESVRRSRELYLVEGYMDVIGLWQAGVQNVGATCGTAVTENHARRLAHLVQRVMLLFDGDSAGQNAAGKSYSVFINSGIDCSAVFLPDGEDPDTIALQHGSNTGEYLKTLRQVPLFDCYVEFLLRKQGFKSAKEIGAAAKGKIAEEIAETLHKIKNGIERAELVERAALKLHIEPRALEEMLRGTKPAHSAQPVAVKIESEEKPEADESMQKPVTELPVIDQQLLVAVMLKRGDLASKVLHHSALCEVLDPATRNFIAGLAQVFQQEGEDVQKRGVQRLLSLFGDTWKAHWIKAHEMRQAGDLDLDALYHDCVRSAGRVQFNQQIKALEHDLKFSDDDAEKAQIAQKLIELRRRTAIPA